MFKNYMKIAIRNLKQNKIYSFISIVGLAIGIASCITIALYVQDELSYDKFNEKAEQIYRITFAGDIGANAFEVADSPAPLAAELAANYPEVVHAGRILTNGDVFIKQNDGHIKEENFLYADNTIFDIFTIPFILGDPKNALIEPNTVVLTQSTARKYFKEENPIGKEIIIDSGTQYKITAIVKDLPANSHYKFDFLASSISIEKGKSQQWLSNEAYTYIVLQKNYNPDLLKKKFPALAKDKMSPIIQQAMGLTYDDFVKSGSSISFSIQSLLDIHLHSNLDDELQPSGDIKIVYIFSAIALIILLLAVINFINLTTARAAQRANEIGIRKVAGSSRIQLIKQFLTESMIVTVIAVGIALLLIEVFMPFFNNLAAKELQTSFFSNWSFLPMLLALIIFVGILSGGYPAFLLSSFKPISVLKGNYQPKSQKGILRKGLVVFQYVMSAFLIIGTIVIYYQMQYVQNKNLGFEKEHVVVIDNASALGKQQQAFKNELLKNSTIVKASFSQTLQSKQLSATILKTEETGSNENHILLYILSDYDFLETYKLELAEGRFFSNKYATDSTAVLLNEAAIEALGFSEALNKRLVRPSENPEEKRYLNIIGVLKNFHTTSLHEKIRPMVALLQPNPEGLNYLSIRIQPGNIKQTIESIEIEWKKFLPGQPMEYSFFDDSFDEQYRAELRTGKVFTSFAVLAIFIASLGLFGLASFTTERRIKEIGVRKVLGASITNIVFLLTKEFSKWVIIANIIAWPLAWYAMDKWLENFAYKVEIGLWIYILSGLITLSIAVFTVCFQAVKAAVANPVKSLKYE